MGSHLEYVWIITDGSSRILYPFGTEPFREDRTLHRQSVRIFSVEWTAFCVLYIDGSFLSVTGSEGCRVHIIGRWRHTIHTVGQWIVSNEYLASPLSVSVRSMKNKRRVLFSILFEKKRKTNGVQSQNYRADDVAVQEVLAAPRGAPPSQQSRSDV